MKYLLKVWKRNVVPSERLEETKELTCRRSEKTKQIPLVSTDETKEVSTQNIYEVTKEVPTENIWK